MNTRASRLRLVPVLTALAAILCTGAALAAEPPSPTHPALSKEQREKMAAIHEQMAKCLRSDKPVADCHREAMQSCEATMGKDVCPMMGHMHGHMMQQPAKSGEAK
ncbi:MAG TPA: hypothetical protein VET46_08965 [Steroidobacteraceae bacterium]|nr:hypothetical protein [Steroidobacteraceae bacterium]